MWLLLLLWALISHWSQIGVYMLTRGSRAYVNNIHCITGEDVRFEPDGSVWEADSSGRHSEVSESAEEPQSESETEMMMFCWRFMTCDDWHVIVVVMIVMLLRLMLMLLSSCCCRWSWTTSVSRVRTIRPDVPRWTVRWCWTTEQRRRMEMIRWILGTSPPAAPKESTTINSSVSPCSAHHFSPSAERLLQMCFLTWHVMNKALTRSFCCCQCDSAAVRSIRSWWTESLESLEKRHTVSCAEESSSHTGATDASSHASG